MQRRLHSHAPGFTLLEILIALAIAMMIVVAAVPSLKGVLKKNGAQESFTRFDKLAQEAHSRSISERRAYVLMLAPGRDSDEERRIILRPDVWANKEEAEQDMEQISMPTDEAPKFIFPASLLPGDAPAIWIFWPNGSCEPATIKYAGKTGKWTAVYNAFTAQAAVTYE